MAGWAHRDMRRTAPSLPSSARHSSTMGRLLCCGATCSRATVVGTRRRRSTRMGRTSTVNTDCRHWPRCPVCGRPWVTALWWRLIILMPQRPRRSCRSLCSPMGAEAGVTVGGGWPSTSTPHWRRPTSPSPQRCQRAATAISVRRTGLTRPPSVRTGKLSSRSTKTDCSMALTCPPRASSSFPPTHPTSTRPMSHAQRGATVQQLIVRRRRVYPHRLSQRSS
mmetsp:Transcript_17267/g.41484  ORF Transcript_17267/g.41484 Transcript_17267/m.41484 type:complete len:222 (-) Transcript_17267:379-1044(-)